MTSMVLPRGFSRVGSCKMSVNSMHVQRTSLERGFGFYLLKQKKTFGNSPNCTHLRVDVATKEGVERLEL